MNKAIEENVNYLGNLVGHMVIRTKPPERSVDWSYTEIPLFLQGFSYEGKMIVEYAEGTFERKIYGSKATELPLEFTDRNWQFYSRVRMASDNKLNKWKRRKIQRIAPTKTCGDKAYMRNPVKLIVASEHHLIIYDFELGRASILNGDYTNPEEWRLAK